MKHYVTTGKLGTAGREYRVGGAGIQFKGYNMEWLPSEFSKNSFATFLRLKGLKEVRK